MEITLTYIISQIFSTLGLICFGLTFSTKKRKTILILSILMSVFYSFEFLFLGSLTGCVIKLIGILRGVWFYFEIKKFNKNLIVSLLFIELLTVVFGILTWKSVLLSLIPIGANMIYAYALWQKNNKVYKVLTFTVSALWIGFSVLIKSLVGVVSRIIILCLQFVQFMLDITKKN